MTDSLRPKSWPYRADIPQRYNDNADLYHARGGLVRLEEDAAPFAQDGTFGDIARFFFLALMQDQILKESLPGDMAELGVYKGMTAAVLATIARRADRTLYLFDTFEGFDRDDLRGIDADKRAGQFTDTSLTAVQARIGHDHVRYVAGRFPQSCEQIPPDRRFCLVHIDCDLYEPIIAALRYFYPRMVPGGFMVMHDYTSLAWNGAERAIDEFFANKPESPVPLTDGAGSAVIRRAKDPGQPVRPPAAPPSPPSQAPSPPPAQAPAPPPVAAQPGGPVSGTGQWTQPTLPLLAQGWSGLEPWGLGRGPGARAEAADRGAGTLEADADVALLGRDEAIVTIWIGGAPRAVWRMTAERNRDVRSVPLPPPDADGTLRIEFRTDPRVPSDHAPGNSDSRPLGMALHRFRVV